MAGSDCAAYRIGWYSRVSDAMGLGTTAFEWCQCLQICNKLNRRWLEIEHFPVEAETREPLFDGRRPGDAVNVVRDRKGWMRHD